MPRSASSTWARPSTCGPAGDPDDLTFRARRILGEVILVVATDVQQASSLLDHHGIATPLSPLSEPVEFAKASHILDALETGDVAILSAGWSPAPSGAGFQLVSEALEHGIPVVSVPGPTFPVTSLVVSGLPAGSFVYLGKLAPQPPIRRKLLASISLERRTLVALVAPEQLPGMLVDLEDILGDRALVVAESPHQTEQFWRGTVREAVKHLPNGPGHSPYVLIIGAARERTSRWEQAQLRGEIEVRLEQGLSVKEISRQLAVESGWPRREIYDLVVEASQLPPGD
ncbi:SAM-dependent methyltransferase [Chloroflexota bacterium]